MKTHLNLPTAHLDESVRFYTTLLDAKPAKVFADYALFIAERPGMELALTLDEAPSVALGSHFGICADSVDDVERAIERLDRAGLVASIEREDTCCYANQTKVWAVDPEGRRWEVYTVHEDTAERDTDETSCCAT